MEQLTVAATTGIRTTHERKRYAATSFHSFRGCSRKKIESVFDPFCRPKRGCPSSNTRRSRRSFVPIIRSSTRPGIDSSNTTNNNQEYFAVEELDPNSTSHQHQLASKQDQQALKTLFSRGLVFELGFEGSWDSSEIGSPVVKRFVGDNEERWYMWYHGRSIKDTSDSIGLAVSGDGVHWTRGTQNANSSKDVGCVMNPSNKWWAFDTDSIRPSQMVVMSNQLHSAVYWLYYTGYSSEEAVNIPDTTNLIVQNHKDQRIGKIFRALPGLACSQDGRHWARIEGDHHSGAVLDFGTGNNDWDSLFIAAPNVVVHSGDDLRMYYHSFDTKKRHFSIGIARSRDGIRWIKLGKIIMENNSGKQKIGVFDELGIRNADVVRNHKGGNYLMAYECVAGDGRTSIGLAESPDGLKNWTKIQEEPVLMPLEDDDGWDSHGVGSPCLVQMNNKSDEFRLYYVGIGKNGKTGIGMAVSEGNNLKKFTRWERSLHS